MTESLANLIDRAAGARVKKIKEGSVSRQPPKARAPAALPRAEGEPDLVGKAVAHVAKAGVRAKQLSAIQRDERYRSFAREFFFSGFNGPAAFKAAGYTCKPKYLTTMVGNLMKEPIVQDELNRLGMVARAAIDAETIDVVKFWKEMAEANIFKFFDQREDGCLTIKPGIKEMPEEIQRTVQKIKVRKRTTYETNKAGDIMPVETFETEVQLWDRQVALVNIGKIQGVYEAKTSETLRDFAAMLADRLTRYQQRVGKTYDQAGRPIN